MTERITIGKADSPEAIFLRAVLGPKCGLYADVELIVNGKAVPVAATIRAFEQGLDQVAMDKAVTLVSESALAPVAEALRNARRDIRRALANLPKGDAA